MDEEREKLQDALWYGPLAVICAGIIMGSMFSLIIVPMPIFVMSAFLLGYFTQKLFELFKN